ncbi:Acyl-CoA N-acyltransferase with RING/FYVE/PHD-type zinc finger protein [Zea mays]|uniref:Acyl-CoA N-acyltransferase with RING/FYVE/PHD-type zinc finger protein n=2 Tax=Zea mays TaxID=4577 RepID=A0A1D6L455_MAIZE|nr:Acyl-CoA N-acyltransferase with RING/FYVE/PHD-type zinc finger protein [Zea mays]ONM09189.1 Acyl-CoA N-acyltransferase with RING/FYVE/PHD-type zinc finger protein [Zea mays]ONM09208.1 Acyl-CoA N-acyltransferase with RING/FYVE/PHD-type zinc finger protein [Zea mays]
MPDATGLEMGLKGSKGAPVPGMEGGVAKAPASLEENKSSADEDLGRGPALTGKKRRDCRGSADEDRNVTKRVLRSDAMKLRAEAEAACVVAVEVSKTDSLERKRCEAIVEAEPCNSRLLMEVTCNGEEANELVNLDSSDVSEESARCSENNMGMPSVPATDSSQDNGLGTQSSLAESDIKTMKSDEKMSTATLSECNDSRAGMNSLSVDEAQDDKVRHGPCQGEVIDSAMANDAGTSTNLIKISPTSGSESVKQENNVVGTEEVILHSSDTKVEKHSHIDDVCTETEISLTDNGICAVDNHTDLTGCTKQEERGSPMNEANDVSSHDIVFTRRGRKSCEAKQRTCEEEARFEKRITRSATVRQREVSASSHKTSTNEAALEGRGRKGDIVAHYTRKVSSAVSPKGHHAELGDCNTSMPKQTVKETVVDRRDSGVPENDNHANVTENKESENGKEINLKTQPPVGIVKKTSGGGVSAVDQNVSGSAITERNDTEHTDSDGVKSENKTPVQKPLLSVGAKIVASKKRILEAELDKSTGRSPIALPSMKKTRNMSSGPEINQPDKSTGDKLIENNCDSGNKRVLRERQHRNQTNLSTRYSNHSNQNDMEQTQDQSDDDEISSDTSYRRTRSRRRCGAARLAVPKQEDSSDSEDFIAVKKNRRKRKKSVHKQRAGSKLKHTSGPSKAGRLGRPPLIKSESSSLSLQPGKGERKVPEGTGTLREEKQKISDQIKAMLLDAGWTIDLRPRNGRNYMDSVYIPPSGKGSYWSVTKAYYAFRAGMESEQQESPKDQSLSTKSVGSPDKRQVSSSSGYTLTEDILSKLKRVVVNKRTTKLEIQRLRQKRFKKEKKKKNVSNSRSLHLGNERKKRGGCALLARGSNKESGSSTDGFVPYEWKRTIFSWLIDLDVLSVNTKLKCMDGSHSKVLLEGFATRDGINCSCCNEVYSVLEFVTHAGSEVNKPYRNILVDGLDIDLLHCLINAWNMQSDVERQDFFPVSIEGDDPNDDTCGICGDGGNLICCDGCPSTFHMSCLGLEVLPSDYWCCANCSCKFCHEHSSDGAEDTADVDYSLHTCSQCEEQYHEACSPETDSITNLSSQTGNLFCQQSCRLLFEELQNLLAVKKDLEPEYSCRVVQRIHEDVPEEVLALDKRVECNSRIAVALSLMDECFLPIIDQRTGINLIRNVVYSCGSNFARLDFRGFYIFILERGDEIIAAASVRCVVSSCFFFLLCFVTV